ncbi:hypothetical protein LNTAR_24873 [Lentisphaera araneosa HTCC2155]|jgi:hypothetical protein|uniref:Uncharacterized protein n=1 Tax=Lentisphaera araneosa HTCC2155 TaxID=313628 RepID=A6DSY2_9BACT|nr:hypothetical protein LNTAR_24873 [Lentisphaera araneosa HTCC2155]
MNKKLIQLIYLISILFLVPYLIKGFSKPMFDHSNLIMEVLLTGGFVGIAVIILSFINWIIYFILKKELLIHIHSIFILLYGYLQTLHIWSRPPPDKIDFRTYETWTTTTRVSAVLIINLILFIIMKSKKKQTEPTDRTDDFATQSSSSRST